MLQGNKNKLSHRVRVRDNNERKRKVVLYFVLFVECSHLLIVPPPCFSCSFFRRARWPGAPSRQASSPLTEDLDGGQKEAPQAISSLFHNKYGCVHLFSNCLWMLSCCRGKVEKLQQGSYSPQSWTCIYYLNIYRKYLWTHQSWVQEEET